MYYFMKDASLLITSPVGSDGSFIGSPAPSPFDDFKTRVGVVVGWVVGVVVLGLIVLVIFLRRRRQRALTPREDIDYVQLGMAGAEGGGVMSPTNPTMVYYGREEPKAYTTSEWPTPASPTSTSSTKAAEPFPVLLPKEQHPQIHGMSETLSFINGPPAYSVQMRATPLPRNSLTRGGIHRSHRSQEVPEEAAKETELAEWARARRAQIPVTLEAKLAAAGYVPTDNPNIIPEEVWVREYGVTILELSRIRGLYRRNTAVA